MGTGLTYTSLISERLGCSDRTWNMISMNKQMHDWWSNARFGLKCLGIYPDGEDIWVVRLQFHWMKRQDMRDPYREITLTAEEVKKFIEGLTTYYDDADKHDDESEAAASAADARSNWALRSGRIFQIRMGPGEEPEMTAQRMAEKMKAMLDFQWNCIRISVMSGAAGSPEFLEDDNNDDATDDRIRAWLKATNSLCTSGHDGISECCKKS